MLGTLQYLRSNSIENPARLQCPQVFSSEGFQPKKPSKVVGEERAEIWFTLAQEAGQSPDNMG